MVKYGSEQKCHHCTSGAKLETYFCELPDTCTAQLLDALWVCFMMWTTEGFGGVFLHVEVELFCGCVHGISST